MAMHPCMCANIAYTVAAAAVWLTADSNEIPTLCVSATAHSSAIPRGAVVQNGDSPPRLVEHVPLYLLGTEQAGEACGIVLEMYCDATPPQAARGRALVATMSRFAPHSQPCQVASPARSVFRAAI